MVNPFIFIYFARCNMYKKFHETANNKNFDLQIFNKLNKNDNNNPFAHEID